VRHAFFEARGGAGVQFDGAAHDGAPSGGLALGRHGLVVGVEEAQRPLGRLHALVGTQLHGVVKPQRRSSGSMSASTSPVATISPA
jgi:hypothetical protein